MRSSLGNLPSTHTTLRPPTPPQEADHEIDSALDFLRGDLSLEQAPALPVQQISSDTPPSSSPLRNTQPDHVIKKVGFLVEPIYHPINTLASSPKSSPAKSKFLRPGKSILKLGTVSPLPTPDDNEQQSYFASGFQTFTEMLEAAVGLLDTQSKLSRLDAYAEINKALQDHDDTPPFHEMIPHLGDLQRYILRDTALREHDETTDSNITVQALKLAGFLVSEKDLRLNVSQDFQTSMLDRCLAIFERVGRSKAIFKTALGFMAQQNLPPSLSTTVKAERLISLLQDAESRYQGVSLIAARLMIYRRLLTQAPHTMLHRMGDWLQHLLHGMLSDTQDTRLRAVDTCYHVALMSDSSGATKILQDLFETPIEDGADVRTYFEHFSIRISDMIKDESACTVVPRIWSNIVLFHRSSKAPLHRWRRFKNWLQLIQPCLNHANSTLRREAHMAWRKLVFVVQPDAKMHPVYINLLAKPMLTGFSRSGTDSRAKELRQLALDGYFNLLHYALRPGLDNDSIGFTWKHFVGETLKTMATASSKGRAIACSILQGLLTAHTGTWNVQAALEDAAISPEELPRLPVKWTRDNVGAILLVVEAVLVPALQSPKPEYVENAANLWTTLINCVTEAGAQEIRQSSQTKAAVVAIIHCLRRTFEGISNNRTASVVLLELQDLSFRKLKVYSNYLELDLGSKNEAPKDTLAYIIRYSNSCPDVACVTELLKRFGVEYQRSAESLSTLSRMWQQIQSSEPTLSPGARAVWTQLCTSAINALQEEIYETETVVEERRNTIIGDCSVFLRYSDMSTIHEHGEENSTMSRFIDKMLDFGRLGPTALSFPNTVLEPLCLAHRTELSGPVGAYDVVLSVVTRGMWLPSNMEDCSEEEGQKAFLALVNDALVAWHDIQVPHKMVYVLLDYLTICIRNSAQEFKSKALTILLPGIQPWIRNSNRLACDDALWAGLYTSILDLLHKKHGGRCDVRAMEGLLLAGFASTSRAVGDCAVMFWNKEADHNFTYSANMQAHLYALSRVTAVDLPKDCDSSHEVQTELPAFAQDELLEDGIKIQPTETVLEVRGSPVVRSPAASPASSSMLKERSKPTRRRLFKSPKLRHDDSQIDFVSIVPPLLHTEESQHLTENQREVMDRQHAEVQLFPELSSSPTVMAARDENHAQLDFELTSAPMLPSSPPRDENIELEVDFTSSPPQPAAVRGKLPSPSEVEDVDMLAEEQTLPSSESDTTKAHQQLEAELAASLREDVVVPEQDHEAASVERSSRKRKRGDAAMPTRKSRRKSSQAAASTDGNETGDEIVVTSNKRTASQKPVVEAVAVEEPVIEAQSEAQPTSQSQEQDSQQKRPDRKRKKRRSKARAKSLSASSTPQSQRVPEIDEGSRDADQELLLQTNNESPPSQPAQQTAAGLVSRLKEALGECRKMVFGVSEEREIDDLLFELRQANHEAGRKGRESL